VLLQKLDVGLCAILRGEELLVGGRVEGGCLYVFAHTFLGAHLVSILHSMQGEVNLGERLLLTDGANSIVNVLGLVDVLRLVLHGGRSEQQGVGSEHKKTVEVKAAK